MTSGHEASQTDCRARLGGDTGDENRPSMEPLRVWLSVTQLRTRWHDLWVTSPELLTDRTTAHVVPELNELNRHNTSVGGICAVQRSIYIPRRRGANVCINKWVSFILQNRKKELLQTGTSTHCPVNSTFVLVGFVELQKNLLRRQQVLAAGLSCVLSHNDTYMTHTHTYVCANDVEEVFATAPTLH